MKDRVPLYPGRVKLTPVAGQANTYDMSRADSPQQEGTPLNKASLLSDETVTLLGLGDDAVPNDALAALYKLRFGNIRNLIIERIAESKTWTAPANILNNSVLAIIVGGGGGGSGCSTYNYNVGTSGESAGGGSGGIKIKNVTVSPGTGYPAVIGAGGTGGASGENTGTSLSLIHI